MILCLAGEIGDADKTENDDTPGARSPGTRPATNQAPTKDAAAANALAMMSTRADPFMREWSAREALCLTQEKPRVSGAFLPPGYFRLGRAGENPRQRLLNPR